MSQQGEGTEKATTDKVKEQGEKVKEQVTATVTDLRDRVQDEQTSYFLKTNAVQIVTAVAVVGILINNRRSLKFTKKIVKNMDKNMVEAQNTIKALKAAGQTFEFYPGVGVWVD